MSEKRPQILRAAEKLFASGRFHEITLDDICREAGVGKGTIYRYFEDKKDLYHQVILAGVDDLVESVRAIAEQEPEPPDGLREVARSMAEFFRRRRPLFGLMHGEQIRGSMRKGKLRKHWHAKNEKIVDVVAGFIKQGMHRGVYRTALGAKTAAWMLMGMIRTGLRHGREMPAGKDWPEAVVELFENGLLVRDEEGTA